MKKKMLLKRIAAVVAAAAVLTALAAVMKMYVLPPPPPQKSPCLIFAYNANLKHFKRFLRFQQHSSLVIIHFHHTSLKNNPSAPL